MKKFNITAICFPDRHYMVDISDRIAQIKRMVDEGEYFCINRGRQYGKTTTMSLAAETLVKDYLVISISFEGMGESSFSSLDRLSYAFLQNISMLIEFDAIKNLSPEMAALVKTQIELGNTDRCINPESFSIFLSKFCKASKQPVVLMIDEVDQASNHPSFIEFLGILRKKYIVRNQFPTFQSVILAGVYDIKNLKLKIRSDADHQYNSPWNIASDFNVDMSFNVKDVEGMLNEYENDYHTGMNIHNISQLIIDYTSGYPFLVSKICKIIDETGKKWSHDGIVDAVKVILNERNTLFDDMNKKLDDFPELCSMLKNILYNGETYKFNIDNKAIELARMFNFICDNNGVVAISNRIFETRLYNAFAFEEESKQQLVQESYVEKNQFIENGLLNIEKIIQRFIVHYNDIYGDKDEKFHEREGRKYFMFYVKPIINGVGNYYIEAETRDRTRTDMIIDYLGKQYIIEMKIWRGNSYNERGEQQLLEYLDYYYLDKGYLVSFCFNKNKQIGVHTVHIGSREIVEGVV